MKFTLFKFKLMAHPKMHFLKQTKALEEGAELVICTPGRIIDMIKIEATNFLRTTFLVFDEVDRMFDLGFGNFLRI